jgi:HEAT repeat protein
MVFPRRSKHVNVMREESIIGELSLTRPNVDRRTALNALHAAALHGVISDKSVPVARRYLTGEEAGVRVAAILALGAIGSEAAYETLADALQEQQNLDIRFTASVLGGHAVRSATPALVDCLQRRGEALDRGAKLALIRALAQMPHRSEVPALAAMLSDRDRHVRRTAAYALGRIRSPDSRQALEASAMKSSAIRGRAIRKALRGWEM